MIPPAHSRFSEIGCPPDNVAANMRLLHVASSYPLSEGDEHAPFMEEMLEALAERGHQVGILVPRVKGLVEGMRNGVEVIGVPYAPTSLQVWGYGRSLDARSRLRTTAVAVTPVAIATMARALRRRVKSHRPDVVHLHWLLPQGALSLILPREVQTVVSLHGADVRYATGAMASITRRVVGRVQAIVAASSGVVEAVSRVAPDVTEKAVIIPHGANAKLFFPRDRATARADLGIRHDDPIVLGVGRLVPKKGFRHLIEAMPMLSDTGAHLHLVGDGGERASLEEAIAPNLRTRIHFEGKKGRTEVALWIAASDVVVIPSVPNRRDIDTGPVVLMEALASGRTVVSSRVGMAPDVISDMENGLLIDAVEPETVSQAVRIALGESAGLGRAAHEAFQIAADWSQVADRYEQMYSNLISPT